MHVLVVDDKESVVKLLTQLLTSIGATVQTATNGLDAFTKAQTASFDLFIVDHLMPVMNGVQLVKNLKSKSLTSGTPVLFISTQDLSEVEALEEYPLFDAVLSKPIDQDLFYQAINSLLPANTLCQSL
ncbi:response regulator [Thalassotalea insulae]|uniref:Response regulator n=1 Tax=Thalassotalea insulae TaxID=2056778 RepID=A0ABQ6GPY7_9GAMM|nr:response regulator [Thalassotalea insulae]GLX77374.1 response regulator [Thalassotalea insulae]